MTRDSCAFCRIVKGEEKADIIETRAKTIIFRPRRPHTPGHVLVVSRYHVRDALDLPSLTGYVMADAARYAAQLGSSVNIITSAGAEATQTVWHLHVHVVPRGAEDGLRSSWPWRVRLSEGFGPGDIFPEEGYEELADKLCRPAVSRLN